MLSKLALSILLVYSSAFAAEAASQTDNLIVPGERVGILTPAITETELKRVLPENQIRRILYDVGEGEYHCATEVFPNSEKAATIIWGSDKALYEPYKDGDASQKRCDAVPPLYDAQFVAIEKSSFYWRTVNGIGAGMNLMQLEKANHAPITFSICECDYGGNVMNWNKGKFSPNLYMHLDYYSKGDLQPSLERYITKPNQGVDSTDVPSKLKSKISIEKIIVYFDKTNPSELQ